MEVAAQPPQPPKEKGFFEGAIESIGNLFGSGEPAAVAIAGGGRSRSRSKKGKMPPAVPVIKTEANYYGSVGPAGAPVQVVGPNPLNKVTRSGKQYGGVAKSKSRHTKKAIPLVVRPKKITLKNADPLGFGIYNYPRMMAPRNLGPVEANMSSNQYKKLLNNARNKSRSRSRRNRR
jgi:hypothetical protein